MSSLKLASLPALRRQQLLSEFTGLKQACPSGVFVTLAPGDSTVWSAVLFVRHGPYAPAILRFQIVFPDSYPQRAPTIIFTTDIFHSLITPLTTYMYSTDIQNNGTVSATDDERLPPGGMSLRHGFPEWFGHVRRTAEASPSAPTSPPAQPSPLPARPEPVAATVPSYMQTDRPVVSMYQVLQYIKSTFDNPDVLDSVPLSAAGNPGAWHAWRTYRRKQQAKTSSSESAAQQQHGRKDGTPGTPSSQIPVDAHDKSPKESTVSRKLGEWNWDGVWEDRVKKGVAASLSEPVLYGGVTVNDELIRFLPMNETEVHSIKDNLFRTLGINPG